MAQPLVIRTTPRPRTAEEALVWDALNGVIDPELGVSIADLGLVYDVKVDGKRVDVVMTTTTPICPLGSFLQQEVIRSLPDRAVNVELVHKPLWSPSMMNEKARQQLGWEPG